MAERAVLASKRVVGSVLLGLVVSVCAIVMTSSPAAAEPAFKAPFSCGQAWTASTYAGHGSSNNAVDFNLYPGQSDLGQPALASAGGTATSSWDSQGGNVVRVDHGGGWVTIYAHLATVTINNPIDTGEKVGTVGDTGGAVSAPHLHFEQRYNNVAQHVRFDGQAITVGTSYTSADPKVTSTNCGPSGSNPIGSFDEVGSPQPGTVRVRGWALDMDAKTTPIGVHVYVGGPAGSGAPGYAIPADKSRPDVGAAYPGTGNNHGFDSVIETSRTGTVPVYVYGINASGTGGSNQLINQRTVTIASASPRGHFDGASSVIPGKVRISAWGFDPSAVTTPISMHLYVGGPAGAPGAVGYSIGLANDRRADVGAAYPGVGNGHGYERDVAISQSGNLTVYLYGIDLSGTPGDNVLLGSKTVSVLSAPQPMASTLSPVLSGKARVGRTLTTNGGTWSQPGVILTYQWLRDGKIVTGATAAAYKLRGKDKGHRLRVRVTAVKDGYTAVSALSARSRKVKK